jgi:hypothetical protein
MDLQFELRRERHAIGEFTASLHFFQPVSAATFSEVKQRLREIAAELDLPSPVPVQVFEFTIGPQGTPSAGPSATSGNTLGFQRFSKEGEVAESLSCDAGTITVISEKSCGSECTK